MQAEGMMQHLQSIIAIVEDISDAVYIASSDRKPEYINAPFKELFNYRSEEEFIEAGGLAGVLEDKSMLPSIFETVFSNTKWEGKVKLRTKNGEILTVRLKAAPITDPNQAVIGAAFFFKDIVGKEDIVEYFRLLQSFVENANDAVMITQAEPIDEPGPRIVYVNPAFTRITGYTNEDVIGSSPRKLQGPRTNRAELDKVRLALIQKNKARVELINYKKNGQEFWVDFSIVPVADKSGKVTHFVSFQQDTTIRKEMEKALLESRKELKRALQTNKDILTHSIDVICSLDREGKFVHINKACKRNWGYKTEEVIGRSFKEFVHPDDLERTRILIEKTISGIPAQSFENRYIHKDGRIVTMMWTGSWSGENQLLYAIGRDISELKVSEGRLRESELLYRTVVQNFPNGAITIIDRDFKVVFIAGKGVMEYNVSDEFFYGKTAFNLYDTSTATAIIEKLTPAFSGSPVFFELEFAGRYNACQAVPLFENGNVNRVMVVSQDVTFKKEAEKRITQSEHLYRSISKNYPNGTITICDKDFKVVVMEGKELAELHLTPEIVKGKSVYELFDQETANHIVAKALPTFEGKPLSFELYLPGNKRFYICDTVPLIVEGEVNQIMIVTQNITDRKKGEEKLEESYQEQRRLSAMLSSILNSLPAQIALVNSEGVIITVNDAWKAFARQNNLHYPDFGVGYNYMKVCEDASGDEAEDARKVSEGIQDVIEGRKKSFICEYPCDSPDEQRWFRLIVSPLNNKVPTDVVVMHVDITEHVLIEQKLQESEQRYKSLFEYHPDAVFSVDLEGKVKSANACLANLAEAPPETLLNKSVAEFIPPEELEKTLSYFKIASEGTPVTYETGWITANNKRLIVAVTKVPIRVNGEIIGLFGVVKDITVTKVAEVMVEVSAERITDILESIGDGFFALDHDFTITYWNKEAERMTGLSREELQGKNLWDIYDVKQYSRFDAECRKALQENIPVYFEEYFEAGGIWAEISAYPSKEGLSVYFRDITERKRAEEEVQEYTQQLEKINNELDQFVYRASHDLRSPLVSILGLITLALTEKEATQKNEYLNLMSKSVNKLDKFIKDIIDYSRNARTELMLSKVNFEELVTDTLEDLKYMEEAQSITINTHIEEIESFYTDEGRLGIVLHNIIANAIRYHDPGKANQYINVNVARQDNNYLQIVVEDNGQGIAEEHQQRIFDMFYRATQTNVGSGLGLYIVKENISKLKGSIEVASVPRKGAAFTISIPNLQSGE